MKRKTILAIAHKLYKRNTCTQLFCASKKFYTVLKVILPILVLVYSTGSIQSQEGNCYCLNIEASQSAMIDECIKFKSNGEFIYKWQSDLVSVEEEGNWTKNGNLVLISTKDQPSDYVRLAIDYTGTRVDSVEFQLIIEGIDTTYGCNLAANSKEKYSVLKFDESGFLKTKLDTTNIYHVDAFLIPHQFQFKIEPNVKSIQINAKMMDKIHRTFFNQSELILLDDKLYWEQPDEMKDGNYWIKVDEKVFERKFK